MSMYPISSQVMTTSTNSLIDFTGIPQTFNHLQIRWTVRINQSTPSYYGVYFNNDTTVGNYYQQGFWGDGAGVSASYASNNQAAISGCVMPNTTHMANTFGTLICDIYDYSSTSKNKVVKWFWGFDSNGSGSVGLASDLWLSTAAINRLTFNSGAVFAAGTRIDVYGISTSTMTGA